MINEDRDKLIRYGIIFIFIFAIISLIAMFINNIIDNYKDTHTNIVEGIENIDDYIIKDDIDTEDGQIQSNLVTNYNTFYTVQSAFNNYIATLIQGKYDESYSLLTQDIRSKYDKNTYSEKIGQYTQENFMSNDANNVYTNSDNLKYLYLVKENVYIGEIENVKGDLIKIGVVLDTEDEKYRVFYVEI